MEFNEWEWMFSMIELSVWINLGYGEFIKYFVEKFVYDIY